jgi:large subunit ribosomal protein L29
MKTQELKNLSVIDLKNKLLEARMKQLNLRVSKTSGGKVKLHEFANTRKLIARIKTILTQMTGKKNG